MYNIPDGTLFLGKNLIILPECPSTNTLAMEMGQAGKAPEGTVVITHHQTSGRGQRGNTWESGNGLNLTFSVVLNPVFLMANNQFQLNKAVALAIYDVLQKYTEEKPSVKWPNDILIGDKKVCGILIENQITGTQMNRSVAGIGLNVNQKAFSSPKASSVSLHSGKAIALPELFKDLLHSLEWRYLQLKSDQQRKLDEDYLQSLYRLGEQHQFLIDEKQHDGIIRNVDTNGKLLVEIGYELRSFDLKEIKYVY